MDHSLPSGEIEFKLEPDNFLKVNLVLPNKGHE